MTALPTRQDGVENRDKGPVIRATYFFELFRNIVALQVEILCYTYYRVYDQLVSQQNTVL